MKLDWSTTRAIAVAAVCSVGVGYAGAQATNSGDIRGTVTDASGALVPDVTVTVVNLDTGVTKVLTTNSDGLYDTSSIIAGNYSVTFEKQGFSRFERSKLTLEVGTSTVNAALKIGATTEEVVVNTDIPLLTTETGQQSTTLEARAMATLPNVGQDWENFAILIPGSSGAPQGSAGGVNPGQEISANGNLPYSNVLADGATSTLSHSANADVSVFETVGELQIVTSAFSAQYGIGGVVFNQISKSGGSQFHGSAYEYLQNNALNASSYGFYGNHPTVPFQRYDNFGGSIGGPIKMPFGKLKDKAFFYFNYDQTVNKSSSNATNTVPTAADIAGDFTGQSLIYDPTTQTIGKDAKGNPYPIRRSFLSETGVNAVPQALLDQVSAKVQQYYPTQANHLAGGSFLPGSANNQGVVQNNFFSQIEGSNPFRKYFGRADLDVTSHNRITASVTQRDNPAVFPSAVFNCPVACQNGDVESYNSQVSDVWTISPRVINEARMGYTYQGNFYTDKALNQGLAAATGWQFGKADDFPGIQLNGGTPITSLNPSANAAYKEHVFDPSDVVTMILGKHVLHFGGEFQFFRDDSTAWGNVNAGQLQFTGQYTQQWALNGQGVAAPVQGTGVTYADFLLGDAQNWNAQVSPEYGARLKSPQVFVQDDYKIRPNLTINLGLRYQIRHGWNEVHGNEAVFDPTVANPATGSLGAYWYGSTHANGRDALQADVYNTVLPRVGFSYLPVPNMTIRGGFGMYAYNLSLDTYGGGMGGAFQSSGSVSDQTNGITPITTLGGTGIDLQTGGPLPYTAASTDPARFNGQSVTYNQFHTPTPEIYQWNLGIQQEINNNTVFELSYVASHGFNLNYPTDLNAIPVGLLSSDDNPTARPYQNYQGISGSSNNGISNYNSLQTSLNRRMANGLSFNVNYTWSHFMDSQSSSSWGSREGQQPYQIANDPAANYSNSNFDVRNAFKGRAVYELPFGQGRQFLNHNRLLDLVLGGYQLSTTVQLTSGQPFTLYTQANSYQQAGSVFPNYTGAPIKPRGGRSIEEWFNPAAFSLPANGTFGNVRRNALNGPGIELVNISAGKKFDIYENVKLQIRADATNAFNHPSYGFPNQTLPTGSVTNADGSTTVQQPGQAYSENSFNGQQITGLQVGGRVIQLGARLEF